MGIPGYEVTADGRVISLLGWRGEKSRELRPYPDSDGYLQVRIVIDGKRYTRKVHSLVATTYCGPRPSLKHEVRHINGDRLDNRAENLAWGTRQENADDREQHGRTSRGARHKRAIKEGLDLSRLVRERDELAAALSTLVASLTWEKKRSGTTYAGFDDARAALAKLEPTK